MQAISPEQIIARYAQRLQEEQNTHTQMLAVVKDFHQRRYGEVIDMLRAFVELFDLIAVDDIVTLTVPQQRHVALVLSEARRYLADAAAGLT